MRLILDKKQFFSHLSQRGFTHLFHANSVETGLSFFSVNSLASREFVEKAGLPQSKQFTDQSDKKFGIWNDLFLNFHDHHRRFNRPNAFGPLAFRVSIPNIEDMLLKSEAMLSVCKKNAESWLDSDKPEDRWIKDIAELDSLFKEPIRAGERRGFFKDGIFPDIVIGNLGTISLNVVDKVIVEQNPNFAGHFGKLMALIEETWPKLYRRPQIVVRRGFCPEHCTCTKAATYDDKLTNGFSFNEWEIKFPQHFTQTQKKAR